MVHLLLPTWCPGCGYGGVAVCHGCWRALNHWFRAEPGADALPAGLPVWASAAYAHQAARVVLAWKSGRRPDLVAPLHRIGFWLGCQLAGVLPGGQSIVVVPAPSGWRRRWAGNEVVAPFSQEIARGLNAYGQRARMIPALRRRGGSRHHLSREQRRADRATSIFLRRRALSAATRDGGPGDVVVVLVDDVLTTGATLAASAAAASEIGAVIGAIVLAATPKPVSRGDAASAERGKS